MRITTAAQAAQRDANAIAAGIDSWTLMYAAGNAAAQFVLTNNIPSAHPITIVAGTGNNGGDAYVVAAMLRQQGVDVLLREVGEPRTPDAKRARLLYEDALTVPLLTPRTNPGHDEHRHPSHSPSMVIDGVLGTGQHGALREAERTCADFINERASRGAVVVALDVPTGVNATTGDIAAGAVRAHHTLAFGTMKRAHVLQREQCGAVTVLDIGLAQHADCDDGAWIAGDTQWLASRVPQVAWNAYKGTRGKLAVIGGSSGMAGAIVLASNAALHSGIGLLHAQVHPHSVLALQTAVPQALTHDWSHQSECDAIAIGPGLGRSAESAQVLHAVVQHARPDVALLLDADALTLIGSDINTLRALCMHRRVVCTPHVGELARMLGTTAAHSLEARVAQTAQLANDTGATILLKGSPTVIVGPNDQTPVVVARGNAALATGGSGDLLTGIVATMLAQGASAVDAAAIGTWVHGRAAEIAVQRAGSVRGVTLHDVLKAMAAAWADLAAPRAQHGVVGHLPAMPPHN